MSNKIDLSQAHSMQQAEMLSGDAPRITLTDGEGNVMDDDGMKLAQFRQVADATKEALNGLEEATATAFKDFGSKTTVAFSMIKHQQKFFGEHLMFLEQSLDAFIKMTMYYDDLTEEDRKLYATRVVGFVQRNAGKTLANSTITINTASTIDG